MIKDITFGQYFEGASPIHRLDPRSKLLLLIYYIVFIFLTKNIWALLFAAAFTVALMLITRISFKIYLKNLKAILPIIIFTGIINALYSESGYVLLQLWRFTVTTDGLLRALYMALRIVLLITVSSVLTYTTTPNDLTDGIERLCAPLKLVGLGGVVHTLAMMMTIALRFIPTLVEETEKIMNAQKARGADLESGSLMQRVKALIPILIPLLISSVRRAYELAEAMECRCYNGGKGRTRLKQMKFGGLDLTATLISLAFGAMIIVINTLFKGI